VHGGLDRSAVVTVRRCLRAVVGREYENRVVANAKIIDGIQELAGVRVDLEQEISPGTIAGLAGKIGMRACRVVCRGVRKINEKRLLGLYLTLHEIDCLVGEVAIDQRPVVQPVRF